MATTQALIDRARLELGDRASAFSTITTADGATSRYETPVKPLSAPSLVVSGTLNNTPTDFVQGVDYTVSEADGFVDFGDPPPAGMQIVIAGTAYRYFSDAEWTSFVSTALLQHLHNRAGVTEANLDPVEDYPVALLAVTEALYALINDAAFDIDISTPEGVGIPRHQRYEQLMEMLVARLDQYNKLSSALNVGLYRIEMFDLKRKSRTTNRFIPTYITQEFEDTRFPVRTFGTIDTNGTTPAPDSVPVLPAVTIIQGEPFSMTLALATNLTGAEVVVTLRKYKDSAAFQYFDVNVTNATAGTVTASFVADRTYVLGGGPYWWDVRIIQNGFAHMAQQGPVLIEERPRS